MENTKHIIIPMGCNAQRCKAHHTIIKKHLIYILPPRFDSKQYNLPINHQFLGIDDIYVIDMQGELAEADGNMPLVDFLASMELKVVKVRL